MHRRPKISLIGGGNIGGTLAHISAYKALGDVVLFDLGTGKAKGKALDIAQSKTLDGSDINVMGTSSYADIKDSDVVIITAGIPRKPGMSRDDLVATNASVMKEVAQGIKKYASNAFLMTKVSFINEIDSLCEKLGANVLDVAKGMGLDGRIGSAFLNPGPGVGGSCFPKDSLALNYLACQNGIDLHILQATINSNQQRFVAMANKIKQKAGENKNLAVLGLAFKAGTDDVRMSPAIEIIKLLLADGFIISAYDPVAMPNAQAILFDNIKYCSSLLDCYNSSKVVAILTEWPEFKQITNYSDFSQKIVLDLRKIL